MDMRGQGESSAEWSDYSAAAIGADILALINHLNGRSAIVIAASKATGAAIWAAVEEPCLVHELVLIGTFSHALSPLRALLLARVLLAPLWGIPLYRAFFPTLYPTARPVDFDTHLQKVVAMLRKRDGYVP